MKLHICQITDCHLGAATDAELNGVHTDHSLSRVIAAIQRDHAHADLVLATGDLAHDGSAIAYRRFRELTGVLDKPVLCLPGNHDDPGLMSQLLNQGSFSVPGVINAGSWRIILLNSVQTGLTGGLVSDEELERLRSCLSNTAVPTLVCLHHQPVPVGSPWMDGMGSENGDALMEILDSFNQVQAVLWGHVHQVFEAERGGIRLLGSPSTCFQFKPLCRQFALDSQGPGFRWLDLHEDGHLETGIQWCDAD